MKLINFSSLEIENLLRAKATQERQLTLEIIELLEEVDRRKIYLERGYASLFDYCVKELKYSESSAHRRVSAMRVVREVPDARAAIEAGSLNLNTVAQAQTFFRAEARSKKPFSPDAKKVLLFSLQNKSARDTERVLAALSPDSIPREKVRAVACDQTNLNITISNDVLEKLEKIRDLLSHKIVNGTYAEVIGQMADIVLENLLPKEKRKAAPAPVRTPRRHTRYISAKTKQDVWRKAGGQCCYKNPVTGLRCTARRFLEYDHIVAFSEGGESRAENLQLLCSGHNKWKGPQVTLNYSTAGPT